MIELFGALALAAQSPAKEELRSDLRAVVEATERLNERQSAAITKRLVSHIAYENCVRRNALSLADKADAPETLAKAAVAFCSDEEGKLWFVAMEQCGAFGETGEALSRCTDESMTKWRAAIEREAFGCVSAKRFRSEEIGVSVCKMM